MAERSDRIHEPADKFLALKEALGKGKTDEAFCDGVLGIKRTTYRSLIGGTHKGTLDGDTQRTLRAQLKPFIGDFWLWPEWIENDPALITNNQRRDTAKDFKHRLIEVLKARAQGAVAKKGEATTSFSPPSPEALFLKRIAQIANAADGPELPDGFMVVAWDRLPFAGDAVPSASGETIPLATRVSHTRNEMKPQSVDGNFATLQMRCETNAEQPWPLTLNLSFGPSHPEGFAFGGGQIEFQFAQHGQDCRDYSDRLPFPGPTADRHLQVTTNGGDVPKAWRLRLTHGGTTFAPRLYVEHAKLPSRSAITIRAVLDLVDITDGEILTATLVIAPKNQT